ncbi:hypothetical protein BC830DRAFT_1173535 [Chytriomyces sp. MP71]|nr:hypothetical protein BC830DRAFT_1173535 [Chytriomyces sp. MP71]
MSDNATQAEIDAIYSLHEPLYTGVAWTTVSASVVQLMFLAFQVCERDTQTDTQSVTEEILKPVNLLIFFMILTNLGSCVLYSPLTSALPFNLTFATSQVLGSLFQIIMMFYTWVRGRPVILAIAPSSTKTCFIVLHFYGILVSIATTLSIYCSISYEDTTLLYYAFNILSDLCSAVMIAFDIFVLTLYVLYMRQVHSDSHARDMSRRLHVISTFGAVTTVWNLLWQMEGDVATYVESSNTVAYWTMNLALNALYLLMPPVYLFIQLAMKEALYRTKMMEVEQKLATVDRAREMAHQNGFPAQQSSKLSESGGVKSRS